LEANFKSSASVFTNIIHIIPNPQKQLQMRVDCPQQHGYGLERMPKDC